MKAKVRNNDIKDEAKKEARSVRAYVSLDDKVWLDIEEIKDRCMEELSDNMDMISITPEERNELMQEMYKSVDSLNEHLIESRECRWLYRYTLFDVLNNKEEVRIEISEVELHEAKYASKCREWNQMGKKYVSGWYCDEIEEDKVYIVKAVSGMRFIIYKVGNVIIINIYFNLKKEYCEDGLTCERVSEIRMDTRLGKVAATGLFSNTKIGAKIKKNTGDGEFTVGTHIAVGIIEDMMAGLMINRISGDEVEGLRIGVSMNEDNSEE